MATKRTIGSGVVNQTGRFKGGKRLRSSYGKMNTARGRSSAGSYVGRSGRGAKGANSNE